MLNNQMRSAVKKILRWKPSLSGKARWVGRPWLYIIHRCIGAILAPAPLFLLFRRQDLSQSSWNPGVSILWPPVEMWPCVIGVRSDCASSRVISISGGIRL